jgi:lysophospholipase L1-like esterase
VIQIHGVIEEGLNSRTFCIDDPRKGKEGRNGLQYLVPCLDSHDPVHSIVLMLGSNELKEDYKLQAIEIAEMLDEVITTILHRPIQTGKATPDILVVAPPLLDTQAEQCRPEYNYPGSFEKSQSLAELYRQVTQKRGCAFLDAGIHTQAGADGVHITQESHTKLGNALAAFIVS